MTRLARYSAGITGCTDARLVSVAGWGLDRPAPDGRPRFVLALEPVSGTVRVCPARSLDVSVIKADRPVMTAGLPEHHHRHPLDP